MINYKAIIASSALLLTTSSFAWVELKVPFISVPVTKHGIKAKYDMSGDSLQKVVCIFQNFHKGSVTYSSNGQSKESDVFGNGFDAHQVYFTSKGETFIGQGLDSLAQYTVDTKGTIGIVNIKYPSKETATCFYANEDSK